MEEEETEGGWELESTIRFSNRTKYALVLDSKELKVAVGKVGWLEEPPDRIEPYGTAAWRGGCNTRTLFTFIMVAKYKRDDCESDCPLVEGGWHVPTFGNNTLTASSNLPGLVLTHEGSGGHGNGPSAWLYLDPA